ncbi:MAG: hypothetical protein IJ225_09050 [Solobacterium sp.]|nr:hypothetical protein [Solobacterium sp.]
MWNKTKRNACMLLAAMLCAAGCADAAETPLPIHSEPVDTTEETFTLPTSYTSAPAEHKEETVTVKADPTGTPNTVTVEVVLSNLPETEFVEDHSLLSDLRTTEGGEEFVILEDQQVIFENFREEIHYKGTSQEELPVGVRISYFLDDAPIAASMLAGKSGHLRIRFDYENNTSILTTVKGTSFSVPIPFTAITLIPLNDHIQNVSVENGKVISLSGTDAVVGIAFPGMEEALRLKRSELTEDIDLPSYVELEADVRDFELDFTTTVFTAGLLEDVEESDFSDMEELADDMNSLQDAANKLSEGTTKLKDGMTEYQDYLVQYNDGVGELGNAIGLLSDGLKTLNGYSDDLEDGMCSLVKGLEQLNQSLSAIDSSAFNEEPSEEQQEQLAQLQAAISDLPLELAALSGILADLSASYTELVTFYGEASQTKQSLEYAKASLSEGYVSLTEEQLEAIRSQLLSEDTDSQTKETIETMLNYYSNLPSVFGSITVPELSAVPEDSTISTTLTAYGTALTALSMEVNAILTYLQAMQEGMSSFEELPELIEALQSGVSALASGSKALKEGMSAYVDGVEQVYDGTVQLKEGAARLPEAGNAMKEGYQAILDGVNALSDGFNTFNKEGIQELTRLGGGEFRDLIHRAQAVTQADGSYDNFSGITEGTTGSVRFMIETESIPSSK